MILKGVDVGVSIKFGGFAFGVPNAFGRADLADFEQCSAEGGFGIEVAAQAHDGRGPIAVFLKSDGHDSVDWQVCGERVSLDFDAVAGVMIANDAAGASQAAIIDARDGEAGEPGVHESIALD